MSASHESKPPQSFPLVRPPLITPSSHPPFLPSPPPPILPPSPPRELIENNFFRSGADGVNEDEFKELAPPPELIVPEVVWSAPADSNFQQGWIQEQTSAGALFALKAFEVKMLRMLARARDRIAARTKQQEEASGGA